MNTHNDDADTRHARWARFRFSVVGPLLSAPPGQRELRLALLALSDKEWRHPVTGECVRFGFSTLERWFYTAKRNTDPVRALRTRRRSDAARSRRLGAELQLALRRQHEEHPGWSWQLHADNLSALARQSSSMGTVPSYSTIRRYMKTAGLRKQRRLKQRHTAGEAAAVARIEQREVRGFEMEYVHSLWHLDFHHGSRRIVGRDGQWRKPLLLAILDDHSRLVCHAQWYLDETAESLVHGFRQALQKRGLPRALMSDNGSAMMSAEFTEGLSRLGILHQPTLPYSPYQNAKQEVLWAQVEGRLMAMLEGKTELTLHLLNEATTAWVEFEYHRKIHSEIRCTPLERLLNGHSVGRPCPERRVLDESFCTQVSRKQRRSDGTFTVDGRRFELPSCYRHLERLDIRYASWDLSHVMLVDRHTDTCVATLYPENRTANAGGLRRTLEVAADETSAGGRKAEGMAPLLKELMAEYAATGLPPAWLPKDREDRV